MANAIPEAKGGSKAAARDPATSPAAPLAAGRSLSDHAYQKLLDMIVHRQLSGGEVLVESRLSASLGLTRTPLREALVRLEGEGLLVKQANRSFAVRSVQVSEFSQSLRVREYLEGPATALAAKRAAPDDIEVLRERIAQLAKIEAQSPEHWKLDNDLHNWLARSSGNAVLAQAGAKAAHHDPAVRDRSALRPGPGRCDRAFGHIARPGTGRFGRRANRHHATFAQHRGGCIANRQQSLGRRAPWT